MPAAAVSPAPQPVTAAAEAPAPQPRIGAPEAPTPSPTPPSPPQPRREPPSAQRSLTDHFGLMNDFLMNQEIVTRRAVDRQRSPGSGLGGPPVLGWSGRLALPFAAAVEFVSAQALPAATFVGTVAPLLGRGDLDYFTREIAPQGQHRQHEWLLGRLAARRAITAWQAARGNGAQGHGGRLEEPEIAYDAEGRPILNGVAMANGEAFLSISHKGGVAVAAVADRPLGIDLEQFTALRDPDGVLRIAFSSAEAALVVDGHGPDGRLVTIAWSVKEAAAKSLGQKMLLREHSFELTAFDPTHGTARISHAGKIVDAYCAIDGDFVCTLAAAP